MSLSFGRVAILGLGVMGGSLARALRALPDAPEVVGWAPGGDGAEALAAGALTRLAPSADQALDGAGLVVYAAPPGATLDLLRRQVALWPPDAVATDVSSLKGAVMTTAEEAGAAHRFVGGHPMTGSEGSGFEASREDLYRGARVWLTARPGARDAAARVAGFWRAVGAVPETTDDAAHDRLMAWVSHLPQAAASAVALSLAAEGVPVDALGPGGRDVTRLANSPPALWAELLTGNAPAVLPALARLEGAVHRLREAVRGGDPAAVRAVLAEGRAWRNAP